MEFDYKLIIEPSKVIWNSDIFIKMCSHSLTYYSKYNEEAWGLLLGSKIDYERYVISDYYEMVYDEDYTHEEIDIFNSVYNIYPLDRLRKQFRQAGTNIIGIYHSHPYFGHDDNLFNFTPSIIDSDLYKKQNFEVNPIIYITSLKNCPNEFKKKLLTFQYKDKEKDAEYACYIHVYGKDTPYLFRNAINDIGWNNLYTVYFIKFYESSSCFLYRVKLSQWDYKEVFLEIIK